MRDLDAAAAAQEFPAPDAASRPDTLPAGRHRLEEEEVREHQRGRLIEAIAVPLRRARLRQRRHLRHRLAAPRSPRATFYGIYQSKDECLFDAHKHYSAIPPAATRQRPQGPLRTPRRRFRATIAAALAFSAEHPQATALLTTGILSAGPEGRSRYRTTIEAIARRLCPLGDQPSRRHRTALAAALFAAPTIADTLDSADPELFALERQFLELAVAYAEPS